MSDTTDEPALKSTGRGRSLRQRLLQSMGLGESSSHSARVVVPLLIQRFAPRKVVDVGCGSGAWLAEFARAGCAIVGYDAQFRPRHSRIPREAFHACDLARKIEPLEKADLALCLEVAEHLPGSEAERLVSELCSMAPVVVFAAGIPLQGGMHHVNEQWQSWWANKFKAHGYEAYDDIRCAIWTDERIDSWYRQDLLVYASAELAQRYGLTRTGHPLDVVHPASWSRIGPMGIKQRLFARR